MKRVLLNWYYHRLDLTQYLLDFSDEMEIIFLYHHLPGKEPGYVSQKKNVSVIYWGSYATPYDLLKEVNPNIVVFADLESFNQIALNIAARNQQIKTFVLQHGFRGAYEVDEALNIDEENNLKFSGTSAWSFRFLLSSLKLNNLSQLPGLLKFIYARKKGGLTTALFKNQFELRRADWYIEFSLENKSYHQKRDGIPDERFIITGNPMFDNYFDFLNAHNSTSDYCLLVDCPFLEANFYEPPGIDASMKNQYLEKLDTWSRTNGKKLKVKLHPLSFEATGLYESKNLEYFKEADLKELVAGAAAVYFVHFSTMSPVILTYKQSIYFHYSLESHGNIFRQLGIPIEPLLDFDEHKPDLFDKVKRPGIEKVMHFLHATDGKATQRVKSALLNHS